MDHQASRFTSIGIRGCSPFWTFRTPALRSYKVRLETVSFKLLKSILTSLGLKSVNKKKTCAIEQSLNLAYIRGGQLYDVWLQNIRAPSLGWHLNVLGCSKPPFLVFKVIVSAKSRAYLQRRAGSAIWFCKRQASRQW